MDIKHLTSSSLRSLLALTDKKESLIKAIADIEDDIARTLKGAATNAVEIAEAVTPFKPAQPAPRKGKAKSKGRSGSLKDRIIALLEAAGSQGLKVKDIADQLGVKQSNVAVWFSTTGKKLTTKIFPGQFAISPEKVSDAPKVSKTSKVAKKGGISPESRAKMAAAAKARWQKARASKA